jgi:hypothetical protein
MRGSREQGRWGGWGGGAARRGKSRRGLQGEREMEESLRGVGGCRGERERGGQTQQATSAPLSRAGSPLLLKPSAMAAAAAAVLAAGRQGHGGRGGGRCAPRLMCV